MALKAYNAANQLICEQIGAPEDNRDFQEIVNSARRLGKGIPVVEPPQSLPGLNILQNTIPQESADKKKVNLQPRSPMLNQETTGMIQTGTSFIKLPVTISGETLDVYDLNATEYLKDIYDRRVNEDELKRIVLNKTICDDPQSFAPYLKHFRDFILPLCFADVHLEMGNYESAEQFYSQASEYEYLNVPIETRVLWLKFAGLYLIWGNELFKRSYRSVDEELLRNSAAQLYNKILSNDLPIFTTNASSSDPQYAGITNLMSEMTVTTNTLTGAIGVLGTAIHDISVPVGQAIPNTDLQNASHKLAALSLMNTGANSIFEDENPLMVAIETEASLNIEKWANGLNFLGYSENVFPIWRYSYLLGLARGFAQHAIQLEREYVNFKVNAENESYTQK